MADLLDARIRPLCSLRLYDKGQGDPYLIDRGYVCYDILQKNWPRGTISTVLFNGRYEPTLEYLTVDGAPIGLTCRAFPVWQDTRLANFSTGTGTWVERRSASAGREYKHRLIQFDGSPNLEWDATTNYPLPENPHVYFTLKIGGTPADHDAATLPPYVAIELGNGQWRLEFAKGAGASLQRWLSGQWVTVQRLAELESIGNSDRGEAVGVLRCLRGRILVSTDGGKQYVSFGFPDGTPATIQRGTLTLRGTGGLCVFGLHQCRYYAGQYTSQGRDTLTARGILATPALAGRSTIPTGAAVSFADLSQPTLRLAQYRATLKPASLPGVPFTFYAPPELYAVQLTYAPITAGGSGAYTTPWDGTVETVDVEEQLELDQASCSVTLRRDAAVPFTGDYRFRKMGVYLGHVNADGTSAATLAFTGYVPDLGPEQAQYNDQRLALALDNASVRFRQAEWDDFTAFPLGGLTPNQALVAILASEGLGSGYYVGHVNGDAFALDLGSPEAPFEFPKRGEKKWTTMVRIASYAGLVLGVLNTGQIAAVPPDYVEPTVTHTWQWDPATFAALMERLRNRTDYRRSGTAVLNMVGSEFGETFYAWAVDTAAENDPTNPRFCPWRQLSQDELPGTGTPVMLVLRTQADARESFGIKDEPELTTPVKLDLRRRQRVRITGSTVGIGNTQDFGVATIAHRYRPVMADCKTEVTALILP